MRQDRHPARTRHPVRLAGQAGRAWPGRAAARKLLLALHPKAWRHEYGEEYLAFLEQVELGPAAVADIIRHALTLHAHARRRASQFCAALAISALFEVVALPARLTANIGWAPTTVARGLALAATVAPWLILLSTLIARRARQRAQSRQTGARWRPTRGCPA